MARSREIVVRWINTSNPNEWVSVPLSGGTLVATSATIVASLASGGSWGKALNVLGAANGAAPLFDVNGGLTITNGSPAVQLTKENLRGIDTLVIQVSSVGSLDPDHTLVRLAITLDRDNEP